MILSLGISLLKIRKFKSGPPPIPDYQPWVGYADSPFLTVTYPYQYVFDNGAEGYWLVYGTHPLYLYTNAAGDPSGQIYIISGSTIYRRVYDFGAGKWGTNVESHGGSFYWGTYTHGADLSPYKEANHDLLTKNGGTVRFAQTT